MDVVEKTVKLLKGIVDGAIHTHNDDDANINSYPIADIAKWILARPWATGDQRILQLISEGGKES